MKVDWGKPRAKIDWHFLSMENQNMKLKRVTKNLIKLVDQKRPYKNLCSKPLFRKYFCYWYFPHEMYCNFNQNCKQLTFEGSFEVATGLFVDQAKVWAEPQATLLIFLPCKAATNRGLCIAFVLPSPNWPSSLSPHVKTSPWSVQATQCRDPVAMEMTFLP